MILRIGCALLLLLSSLTTAAVFNSSNTALLSSWLPGIYESTNVKFQDEDLNVTLHILPIWQDRSDGKWFYIESNIINKMTKPFRQRILQFVATPNDHIRMYTYRIPRASDFAGAYFSPELLASLTPSQISIRNGCELDIKHKMTDIFVGVSDHLTCISKARNDQLMTTFLSLSEFSLSYWNRGVNENGKVVLGAEQAPMSFIKIAGIAE